MKLKSIKFCFISMVVFGLLFNSVNCFEKVLAADSSDTYDGWMNNNWKTTGSAPKDLKVVEGMNQYLPDNLPGKESWAGYSALAATLQFTGKIIDIIIYISGTLAVIGVIVGGARYMFSFGGDGKEQAKSTLIWSLLGLLAVMLSYAIVHNVIRIILEAS